MSKVYFITETYLKANSPINLNVEVQLINVAIQDAQRLRIQSVLGSKLYNKIASILPENTGPAILLPANANYKTLLDEYIVPATVQWTIVEALPYIRYKIMNKGVTSQASDNSTPIDLEELKYLTAGLTNKAEFMTQRMSDYLCQYYTLFPEYRGQLNIADLEPTQNAYFSGIQLDDSCDCDKYVGYNNRTTTLNW